MPGVVTYYIINTPNYLTHVILHFVSIPCSLRFDNTKHVSRFPISPYTIYFQATSKVTALLPPACSCLLKSHDAIPFCPC